MIKVNDYVIYGTKGVCEITDIEKDATNPNKEYYILKPISGNLIIKTPVKDSKAIIRDVLTASEVNKLIEDMPEVELIWINDAKERSMLYKQLLKTGKCSDLIKVIKAIYFKNKEDMKDRKKISFSDKEILEQAQKRLFEEFGFALKIPSDQVEDYILNYV